jgi:predicted transcriptional regulator
MTRKQALTKLLALGPLTVGQMAQIMGGYRKSVYRAKASLMDAGAIKTNGVIRCPVSRRKTHTWGIYE